MTVPAEFGIEAPSPHGCLAPRVVQTPEQALALLRAMRARLDDPAHWTQRVFARDERGRAVFAVAGASDPSACSWCVQGAAAAELGWDVVWSHQVPALGRLREVVGRNLGHWNNNSDHHEVLAALDATIADLAGGEGT